MKLWGLVLENGSVQFGAFDLFELGISVGDFAMFTVHRPEEFAGDALKQAAFRAFKGLPLSAEDLDALAKSTED